MRRTGGGGGGGGGRRGGGEEEENNDKDDEDDDCVCHSFNIAQFRKYHPKHFLNCTKSSYDITVLIAVGERFNFHSFAANIRILLSI